MTEVETLLLDSLKKLTEESAEREKESTEREKRLIAAFESRMQEFLEHSRLLTETYEALEKRLVALENNRK